MTLLEQFGLFLASYPEKLSALDEHAARRALLDWQAALIAGSDSAVAEKLILKSGFDSHCDSTLAAMDLYKLAKHDLVKYLANSSHRNRLAKLDLERDIKYCLTPNQCPVVPLMEGKFLVKG